MQVILKSWNYTLGVELAIDKLMLNVTNGEFCLPIIPAALYFSTKSY